MSLWLWRMAAALSFWSFGFYRLKGGDLYWHVAIGKLLLQKAEMVYEDPWSFSQPQTPWIQHEWLSDVGFGLLDQCCGLPALVYWKWTVLVTMYMVLFELALRRTSNPLASYLACLGALALGGPFMDFRPHLYSMLAYAILLAVGLGRPLPGWLPIFFILWSNLHGGVMFGLMVIGLLVLTQGSSWRLALACGLGAMVNAAGLGALGYCFKYAFNPNSPYLTLNEWRSPFSLGAMPNPVYPLALAVMASCLVLILARPALRNEIGLVRRGPGLASLALLALTLAMSLRSARFTPFFAISTTLLTAPCLAFLLAGRQPRWLVWLAALFAVCRLSEYPKSTEAFPFLIREDTFPVDTLDFVQAQGWRGKVFNYYGWGGYLHYRTEGDLQVFADQRADTVFSEQTFQRYLDVLTQQPHWIQHIEYSGAEAFLWPREHSHGRLLVNTGRWRLVHEDGVSVLLLRQHLPCGVRPLQTSGYRHYALAVRAAESGLLEESEQHLEECLKTAPQIQNAWLALARLQEARQDRAGAGRTLKRGLRYFPDPAFESALHGLNRQWTPSLTIGSKDAL